MQDATNNVKITIMDRVFTIKCPNEDFEDLQNSAKLVEDKMLRIKRGNRFFGNEQVAVAAALNIAAEALRQKEIYTNNISSLINHAAILEKKIEGVLDSNSRK